MNNTVLRNTSKALAWLMATSMAVAFAAPQALAFENLGTFKYQWIAQSGTISADGKAHEIATNPGDTVSMSLTIRNRSTSSQALTMYGKSALLSEGPSYPNAHAVGVGTSHPRDNVPAWLDASSFTINGNRFTYYDGAAVNPGQDLTLTWTVKIKSTATNGTYDLYTEVVREFDGWAQQVTAGGKAIASGDIFWRFLIGGTVTGGGNLNVGIAGTTPAALNVAVLATDVVVTKINFAASASDNALVSSIAIRRDGLSADDDASDIKIYDGDTKLGSTQGLNTTTHKATFTGLSWLIPAGTTKILTVKITIPSTADVGKIVTMGIDSASDVVLSGGGTVAGTFPATGNNVTVGGVSVGYLAVTAPTSPASANVVSGTTDQDLGSFKFATSATEGFDVNSLTLTEVGTSVDSDVKNMKLKVNGVQIGSTVASLSGGKVTFTGSPLFSVAAGQNKVVYVAADVASGITSQRTIIWQVEETTSVVAYGQNSNGVVTITSTTTGTAFSTLSAAGTFTIIQGTITVAEDATTLTAQAYIIGDEQIEVAKFKFSSASTEGVKITKLKLEENGDAVSTDYQNVRIYVGDSATPISTAGSVSGTTTTFEEGNGLFTIPASGNTIITIKLDISSSAAAIDTLQFGVGNANDDYSYVTGYGSTSGEKIPQDTSHITLTTCADTDAAIHTIAANGTLVISVGPNTPAAANVAKGVTNYEFTQFRAQATSEAMRVTAVASRFFVGAGTGTASATGDVNNVKLLVWNGTAWTQLGSTVSNPTTGVASFSFDYTVPKNTTSTFKVVGDIPTGTAAASLHANIIDYGIADDITSTGVSSAADITETGSAIGLLHTVVAPIITVNASTVPGDSTLIVNGDNELLGKFFLSANDVEDIKVSTLKIYTDIDGTMDGASAADLLTNTVYLRFNDGGTWRATNPDNWATGSPDFIIFAGSDFKEPNEWIIPAGGSLVVEIRGDVIAAGTAYVGMTTTAANTVGAGLSSGTSATIYDYQASPNQAYNQIWKSGAMTLSAGGTITITAATNKPAVQQVTSTWNVSAPVTPTFFKIKLEGTSEDIIVDAIRAKLFDGNQGAAATDDNFAGTVYVWEGGTIVNNVLTGGVQVGSGSLIPVTSDDAAADIVFTTPITIPKDGVKYLTLTAEMNSDTNGADSADTPYIGLDYNVQTGLWDSNYADDYNVRATGVSSNAKLYSEGTIAAVLKGNATFVVKAKLGMEMNSGSPSGLATRHPGHPIFIVNMTNTSGGTDARFRAASANAVSAITSWATTGDAYLAAVETNTTYDIDGTSLKFTASGTSAVDDGFYYDDALANDLSAYERVSFWLYSSAAVAAGDLEFVISSETADMISTGSPEFDEDIPAIAIGSWQRMDFALSGLTSDSRYYGVVVKANPDDSAGIYIDNIQFYDDMLNIDLSSDGGLFNTTGASTNPAVTFKDSSGTTVATGYVSGTGTAGLSTSTAKITMIPNTEWAIPAGGDVLTVLVDTTVLMNAASEDLTMTVDLGSSNSDGDITAGDVMWNDNEYASSIDWVDSPTPLSRGLNF